MFEGKISPQHVERLFGQEAADFITAAGVLATDFSQSLYLVGGTVRDLILNRQCRDIDFVLEGDAISFANQLGVMLRKKVKVHPRFGTAKMDFGSFSVDIATARSESYVKPGSLPSICPSNLYKDLERRDFSINAIAINALPKYFGAIHDPFQGMRDLHNGLLRTLHNLSFVDDATRIWRAARYAGRLGLTIEPVTYNMLIKNVPMIASISGDRLRHELLLILLEDKPEFALSMADDWGVLGFLDNKWRFNSPEITAFESARRFSMKHDLQLIYLSILFMYLGKSAIQLSNRLNLPGTLSKVALDAAELCETAQVINPKDLREILNTYAGRSLAAIQALSLLGPENTRETALLFLNQISRTRTSLNGAAIARLGVPIGPAIKEALAGLLYARINGEVTDAVEEERWIMRWQRDRAPDSTSL
jgi:tRNA nucleotidyltransferase (CCA-adding enzyme)